MSQNDLSPGWTPLGFLRDLKPKQPQLPPSSTSRNLNPDAAPFMPRPSSSSSLEGSKLMDRVDLIRMLNLHQHQRLIITEDAWNLMIENKWMFQRYPCPLRTAMGRQQQQQHPNHNHNLYRHRPPMIFGRHLHSHHHEC
ncbi:hypothetical protein BLOT_014211 [Blomia tropicalis]|nr:hypothetical protein BLOT_014211 [Blomia tropicalis]